MKKLMVMILCGSMVLSTFGCTQEPEKVESEKEVVAGTNEEVTADSTTPEATSDDSNTGEVMEENGMRKEPIITEKELNITGTTGPINYNIEAIQVSKLTATTEAAASMLGIELNKEVALVAIDASAENTSADTIHFYLGQATLTTNTKEQVQNEMFLSEHIQGDYIGNVIHSGSLVYILKNSTANELTNITLHISAPSNSSFQTVGEDVAVDIAFQ